MKIVKKFSVLALALTVLFGLSTMVFAADSPSGGDKVPAVTAVAGSGQEVQEGSTSDLSFTFKGSKGEALTAAMLKGVKLDGVALAEGDYTVTEKDGALVITLKGDKVKGLKAGTHNVVADFDGAEGTVQFKIVAKGSDSASGSGSGSSAAKPAASTSGATSPKTGVASTWTLFALAGMIFAGAAVVSRKRAA